MRHKQSRHPTEQGLTLIESLTAVVILGISVVAISPPIALSIAARVRAHRAQQAMQLAQGEVDRVRLLVENLGPGKTVLTSIEGSLPPDRGNIKPQNVPVVAPPSTIKPCHENLSAEWCSVHLDEDNQWDMAIQRFRTYTQPEQNSTGQNTGRNLAAFILGVRVYTRASIDAGNLSTQTPIGTASLALSAASSQGGLPLAASSVPIVKSDSASAFDNYNRLLTQMGQ
ncbi:prepilin-type N-terminal cleavage/methylation domain-containing protein [Oscillatoria sp. HE19RPO]|uniref:type IV pilus modification PilV family protein n=1 Tax=Oscillatoria sp. HE19RPO TaxID=2954806 RepID=UPI0020C3DA27|nr:type II secretion system protein [Oscillatoria sp. HE19RPO]